jgi:hypothetical protein
MSIEHSGENLPGAIRNATITATATEQFVAIVSPAPSLLLGYRVANTGETNAATIRVVRKITPGGPWIEVSTEELAHSTAADDGGSGVEIMGSVVGIGVASTSGTTVTVELLVAK